MIFVISYIISILWFSYRRPAVGVILAANAFLFGALHSSLSGGESLISLISPISAFILITIRSLISRRTIRFHFGRTEGLLLTLLFVQTCTTLYSPNIYITLEYVARLFLLGFSFYFMTKITYSLYTDKAEFFGDTLKAIEWIGFSLAFIALWYGASSSSYIIRLAIGDTSSIPLAISLGLSLMVAVYSLIRSPSVAFFLIHMLAVAVIGYALMGTNTRSVVIGFGLGLLFLIFYNRGELIRTYYHKFILALLSGAAFILYVVTNNPDLVYRLTLGFSIIASGRYGESESSRVEAWNTAFEYFANNPIIGIGGGIFESRHGMYPHNIFLEIMSQSGLLGLIALCIWLSSIVLCFFRSAKDSLSPIFASLAIYLFFVAQVSLSFWMHKMLFVSLAIVVLTGEKRDRKIV